MNTEIVDIETLSPGEKFIDRRRGKIGKIWLILGNEPTDATEENYRVRLTAANENMPEITVVYPRDLKVEAICGPPKGDENEG